MTDRFSGFTTGLESPALNLAPVTPDDATDLAWATRGINVATSGAVRVTTVGGDDATIYIAAGIAFPIRVTRVWATGTTATGIMAMG